MQPLSPRMRAALKQAHPGLTDEIVDRVEALLALRSQLDPERQAVQVGQLDRQRADLLAQYMPRYADVVRSVRPGSPGPGWPSVTARTMKPEARKVEVRRPEAKKPGASRRMSRRRDTPGRPGPPSPRR